MHTHAAYTCGIHMHMHMLRSPRGSSALMSSLPRVRLSRLRATASTPWPVASGEWPWPRLLVPMSSETSSAGSRAWVAHGCGIGDFGRTRKRLVASRIDDFGGASERLQALAPGFGSRAALLVLIKQPQLCAGTQRATVRKVAGRKVGAASRGRPALPLPG